MEPQDARYIRQTLSAVLGVIIMMPDTEEKGNFVERIKRSMEKVDAAEKH